MTFTKAVADQAGLVQRCRQHRPVADALEGEAVIAADGEADGGIDRDGDPATPAAGIAVHGIAVAHDVHREDPVLVETAQPAKRDDGLSETRMTSRRFFCMSTKAMWLRYLPLRLSTERVEK